MAYPFNLLSTEVDVAYTVRSGFPVKSPYLPDVATVDNPEILAVDTFTFVPNVNLLAVISPENDPAVA